jgi:hypothetical protein
MSSATTALNEFVPEIPVASRPRKALQSLMQMWEQEHGDDAENETELMVMLSGMVGGYATGLDEQ